MGLVGQEVADVLVPAFEYDLLLLPLSADLHPSPARGPSPATSPRAQASAGSAAPRASGRWPQRVRRWAL